MKKREAMVKKVLMMLLVLGLLAGSTLPVLAVGEVELHKLTASDAEAWDWFGGFVAISGTTAIVGARGNDDAGSFSGSAYLVEVATGSQIAKLTASDAAAGDEFGCSVAISGTTAIVGAYGDDDAGSLSGSAYLYDFSDPCSIIETKLTAADAAPGAEFGRSVAISGNTALVGAHYDHDAGLFSGSAYLYDFSDPCNIIETKLTASNAANGDEFGQSVALSGSNALVGTIYSNDVYLFDFSDPCNITETKLTAYDPVVEFGISVDLSSTIAIVGERNSAYLFDVSTGSQIERLTGFDSGFGNSPGSVGISGAKAIVGATSSAYLFEAATGRQIGKMTASDDTVSFGSSVDLSGSTAIVGAQNDSEAGIQSGAAYLFDVAVVCQFAPAGDNNLDCKVDFTDFALMVGNWLVNCSLYPSDPACLGP
jgi:hypothetical protein